MMVRMTEPKKNFSQPHRANSIGSATLRQILDETKKAMKNCVKKLLSTKLYRWKLKPLTRYETQSFSIYDN